MINLKELKKKIRIFLRVHLSALVNYFSFSSFEANLAEVTSVLLSSNTSCVQVSGTEIVITTGDSLCTSSITGSFVLKYRKGVVFCGDVEYLLPVTFTSQNPIYINELPYKGTISLEENNAKLCVVNYVDVEDYLTGVLAREMSPNWPLEALKAQAVLARTYLLQSQLGSKHGKYAICATTHCQVYIGITNQCENIKKALSDTRDLFLYYRNKPAQVFYFEDSGGITASAKDVWYDESKPYLVSKPNPDIISQQFSAWAYRCNMSFVQKELLAKGIDLGTILSITPTRRDKSGRVKRLKVKGQNGTKTIPVALFCAALGPLRIKSKLFKFAKLSSTGDDREQPDALATASLERRATPNKKFAQLLSMSETKKSITNESATGDEFMIICYGNGHGVGMPQNQCKYLAQAGWTYDQILAYYFPGTVLTQVGQE